MGKVYPTKMKTNLHSDIAELYRVRKNLSESPLPWSAQINVIYITAVKVPPLILYVENNLFCFGVWNKPPSNNFTGKAAVWVLFCKTSQAVHHAYVKYGALHTFTGI